MKHGRRFFRGTISALPSPCGGEGNLICIKKSQRQLKFSLKSSSQKIVKELMKDNRHGIVGLHKTHRQRLEFQS